MNQPAQKVELLCPGGDLEKLKQAIRYGADACYIAGQAYGLRTRAGNFTPEEMAEALDFAHSRGAKVYVVANLVAHEGEDAAAADYFRSLEHFGIDAVLISDPGLIAICQQCAPDLPIHLSTQASALNYRALQFWQEQGLERVVLGRETSLEEIKELKAKCSLELEYFVHGAMCVSYSGRCVLSNHLLQRDANRGGCAQPCRWVYDLYGPPACGSPLLAKRRTTEKASEQAALPHLAKRPTTEKTSEQAAVLPITPEQVASDLETEQNLPFSLSAADLALIDYLPELIEAGVDSLKIEGRMKSLHYVATVTNVYRTAIDRYYANPEAYRADPDWKSELAKAAQRQFSTGFLLGRPTAAAQSYSDQSPAKDYSFVGLVIDYDQESGLATLEQRGKFSVGDRLEFIGPAMLPQETVAQWMINEEGEQIESCPHPQMRLKLPLSFPVKPYDLVRKLANPESADAPESARRLTDDTPESAGQLTPGAPESTERSLEGTAEDTGRSAETTPEKAGVKHA